MKVPVVSLIVPVYNVEKYLHKCLDSILSQTFTDFELLLINDGSKDNSGGICDEYAIKDSRVRVFHKENGGVSKARNLGIDKAHGKWIAFIDSDDWVDNTYFEHLLKYEQVEFISMGYQMQNRSMKFNSYVPQEKIYSANNLVDFYQAHIATAIFRAPWCKLFLTEKIKFHQLNFLENMSFGEDTIFTINYLKNVNNIAVISSAEYYRRFNIESLANTVNIKGWDIFLTMYKREVQEMLERFPASLQIQKDWANRCFTLAFLEVDDLYKRKIALNERAEGVKKAFSRLLELSPQLFNAYSPKKVLLYKLYIQNKQLFNIAYSLMTILKKI